MKRRALFDRGLGNGKVLEGLKRAEALAEAFC